MTQKRQGKIRLESNPFYRLHAMPSHKQQEWMERAEEMALLYGLRLEEEETALLNPKLRLEAEVGYFPGTDEEQVRKVRSFLETGGPAPDFSPSSRLALFNGANVFLNRWPIEDAQSAAAAVFSYARLADPLSGNLVMKELNADRERAGLAPHEDLSEVTGRLLEQKAQAAADLGERIEEMGLDVVLGTQSLLADAYTNEGGEYYRSPSIDAFITRYTAAACLAEASKAVAVIQKKKEEYIQDAAAYPSYDKKDVFSLAEFNKARMSFREETVTLMITALEHWNKVTGPARRIARAKGYTQKEANALFRSTHFFVSDMNNRYMDYQNAYRLLDALIRTFTDENDQNLELMRKNMKIIRKNAGK